MQNTVETDLDAGEPGGDEAANADGDAAGENPPEARGYSKRAGRGRAAGVGVDGPQPHARTQQTEQELEDDDENNAPEDRSP